MHGQQSIKNPVISLFFETSRQALGVTQPPTHPVSGGLYSQHTYSGTTPTAHLHLVSRLTLFYTSALPNAFMARCITQNMDSAFSLSNINIKGDKMGGICSMDGRMVCFIFRSLKLMYYYYYFFFCCGAATQRRSWPPHS